MPAVGLNLTRIKQSLDSISADVEQGLYDANMLKDWKLSVDQLRLALWVIISYEDQRHKEARGGAFGLGEKLAEFRIKRLLQILSAIQEDLQKGKIPPSNPDLMPLSSA